MAQLKLQMNILDPYFYPQKSLITSENRKLKVKVVRPLCNLELKSPITGALLERVQQVQLYPLIF